MFPDGSYATYDKRHLFSMAGEDAHFTAGQQRTVWEWKGWRFLPQVCYDLRFPVFARNLGDYDVYLNVANWPEKRSHAWRTLLVMGSIIEVIVPLLIRWAIY
jgi:predicted amidohydrolase